MTLSASLALWFNGVWDSNGIAEITEAVTSGKWSFSMSAGPVIIDVFSYEVWLISLDNGDAMVVLKWEDARSDGTSVAGIHEIGRIHRGTQTLLPISAGTGTASNVGVTITRPSGRPFGSGGFWEKRSYYDSYGSMGADGKYYCIGVTVSYWAWVPLVQDPLRPNLPR